MLYGICFTINNYTDANVETLKNCIGKRGISYIVFGHEKGDAGTPHLQGYLQSTQKQYKRFQSLVPGHYERQKADSKAASEYCIKDGDWSEFGSYEHIPGKTQGTRTDLLAVTDAIKQGLSYKEIRELHTAQTAKYSRFIKEWIFDRSQDENIAAVKLKLARKPLYPWQQTLLNALQHKPSPRKIAWIWEPLGKAGKTWMANYLMVNHQALILKEAPLTDLAYTFSNQISKLVIFDLTRSSRMNLTGVYSMVEALKDGTMLSTKYESKVITFPRPHVIVLANYPPNQAALSADRWIIREIVNSTLTP